MLFNLLLTFTSAQLIVNPSLPADCSAIVSSATSTLLGVCGNVPFLGTSSTDLVSALQSLADPAFLNKYCSVDCPNAVTAYQTSVSKVCSNNVLYTNKDPINSTNPLNVNTVVSYLNMGTFACIKDTTNYCVVNQLATLQSKGPLTLAYLTSSALTDPSFYCTPCFGQELKALSNPDFVDYSSIKSYLDALGGSVATCPRGKSGSVSFNASPVLTVIGFLSLFLSL